MAGDEDFKMAAAQLRTRLQQFIGVAEAADADSWGADIFRRLLGYARAVLEDLVEVVGNGQVHAATLEHVSQLGAELDLQRWADVWPSHTEYTDGSRTRSARLRRSRP